MTADLAARIAAAGPAALLPTGRDVAVPYGQRVSLIADASLDERTRLVVVRDDEGRHLCAPIVDGERRAVAGEGASTALIDSLREERPLGEGFPLIRWYSEPCSGESAVAVDQTNESVIVGGRAVVKWSVDLPPGPHPAPERLGSLTERGFDGMPRPWGVLQWRSSPSEPPRLVATVVEYVPDAEDGWQWAVEEIRAAALEGTHSGVRAAARRIGALVGELHVGLSGNGSEPMTADYAAEWASAAIEELTAAIDNTDGSEGERLAARSDEFASRLRVLASAAGTPMIDIHGDLHVGQVLRTATPQRYLVTDFDGNPVLTPSERIRKQPAAQDVAGMLQSLDNAGHVVVRRTEGVDAARVRQLTTIARGEFLAEYRSTVTRQGLRWLLDETLLGPLRIRQICREYLYAAHHLPRWRYVPDAAVRGLDLMED